MNRASCSLLLVLCYTEEREEEMRTKCSRSILPLFFFFLNRAAFIVQWWDNYPPHTLLHVVVLLTQQPSFFLKSASLPNPIIDILDIVHWFLLCYYSEDNKWCVDLVVDDENEPLSSNLESEFAVGVKGILDAVHPSDWTTPEEGEDNYIPTLLMPWRGMNNLSSSAGGRRSTSTSSSSRGNLIADGQ